MNQSRKTIANKLIVQGFDQTYIKSSGVRPTCSQCQALVINGTATHETECPNARHECRRCGAKNVQLCRAFGGICEKCWLAIDWPEETAYQRRKEWRKA